MPQLFIKHSPQNLSPCRHHLQGIGLVRQRQSQIIIGGDQVSIDFCVRVQTIN